MKPYAPAKQATRGRPAKLSRERIIAAAELLLAELPPEQISLAMVGEHLDVPPTSIYNYFPNRDALVRAVAQEVFAQFDCPKLSAASWQTSLLTWLRAVGDFFDRYPIAFYVIALEGRILPAWSKVRSPVVRLLRMQGLHGRDLSFAIASMHSQLVGTLFVERYASLSRSQPPTFADNDDCDELELRSHYPAISRRDVVEALFANIVRGVELILESRSR